MFTTGRVQTQRENALGIMLIFITFPYTPQNITSDRKEMCYLAYLPYGDYSYTPVFVW